MVERVESEVEREKTRGRFVYLGSRSSIRSVNLSTKMTSELRVLKESERARRKLAFRPRLKKREKLQSANSQGQLTWSVPPDLAVQCTVN